MKINHGVFEKALGEEGVLGTVLQSGLCDKVVDKVHAPATLWITTKVKVRDVDFPYGSNRKQLTTAFIRRYLHAPKLMACRKQSSCTLRCDVAPV